MRRAPRRAGARAPLTLERAAQLHNEGVVQHRENGLLGQHVLHLRVRARSEAPRHPTPPRPRPHTHTCTHTHTHTHTQTHTRKHTHTHTHTHKHHTHTHTHTHTHNTHTTQHTHTHTQTQTQTHRQRHRHRHRHRHTYTHLLQPNNLPLLEHLDGPDAVRRLAAAHGGSVIARSSSSHARTLCVAIRTRPNDPVPSVTPMSKESSLSGPRSFQSGLLSAAIAPLRPRLQANKTLQARRRQRRCGGGGMRRGARAARRAHATRSQTVRWRRTAAAGGAAACVRGG